MNDQEAVTGSADTPAEGNEATARTESLDDVLNDWESSPSEPKNEQKPESSDDVKERLKKLEEENRAFQMQRQREQTEKEFNSVVDQVSEGLDVDRELVEGVILLRAEKDQRLAKAFLSRHENPKQWQKVVEGLRGDISQKFNVDKAVTEDKAAARNLVRGQSTKASEPEDKYAPDKINTLSNWELNQVTKEFGVKPI